MRCWQVAKSKFWAKMKNLAIMCRMMRSMHPPGNFWEKMKIWWLGSTFEEDLFWKSLNHFHPTNVNVVFSAKSSNSTKNMGILRNTKISIFNLGEIVKRSSIQTYKRCLHHSSPKIQANRLKITKTTLKSAQMARIPLYIAYIVDRMNMLLPQLKL